MRRFALFLIGLLVTTGSLVVFPARADGLCYRIRVAYKGLEVLDQRVGMRCWSGAQQVLVERQVVAETTIETFRFVSP